MKILFTALICRAIFLVAQEVPDNVVPVHPLAIFAEHLPSQVEAERRRNNSALLEAVKAGDIGRIYTLINETDVDVNWGIYDKNKTFIMYAAHNGDVIAVRALIEGGADVNAVQFIPDFFVSTRGIGFTFTAPIVYAVQSGNPFVVDALINAGADVNFDLYNHGQTPLMIAAERGDVASAELLIDAGADVDFDNSIWYTPRTPLGYAVRNGRLGMVGLLVENGADPNEMAGCRTPLGYAAEAGDGGTMVRELLALGADAGIKDCRENYPFRYATDLRLRRFLRNRACPFWARLSSTWHVSSDCRL